MARQLTKKQKGFAKDYLETGNGTKAALANYNTESPDVAASIAVENLGKPKIQEYLADKAMDASTMIYNLSQFSKQDFIKLNASKDILDRAGYGAVSKSESKTLNVDIKVDNTEAEALGKEYDEKLRATLLE